MNPYLIIPIGVLLLAALLFSVPHLRPHLRAWRMASTMNSESAAGTRGALNLFSDAAHTYTHLLIKAGSDADHGAVCGAGDLPIGLTDDRPSAAESLFNVRPLATSKTTRKVRVATALAAGIDLYTAANGFAQAEPGVAGTYYLVGRSVEAASQVGTNDYLIEFIPRAPLRVVVIAAMTSTNGTAGAAADLTALKAEAEKIGDDVRAIAAALATPSLVKVLA